MQKHRRHFLSPVIAVALALQGLSAIAANVDYLRYDFGRSATGFVDGMPYDLWFLQAAPDGTSGALSFVGGNDQTAKLILKVTIESGEVVATQESSAPIHSLGPPLCDLTPAMRLLSLDDIESVLTTNVLESNNCFGGIGPPAPVMVTAARGQPVLVRSALLAGVPLVEAIPVEVSKGGVPWRTYYFGHSIGIIKVSSHYAGLGGSFTPTSLPPAKKTGELVEYVNEPDFPLAPAGHFFYSGDPLEQAAIDSGAAGHWRRTGKTISTGGYLPVCRFYGSVTPGPNSHFFTVDPEECEQVKRAALNAPPGASKWNFEGNEFYAAYPSINSVGTTSCAQGAAAVYRAYNNAFESGGKKNPWDSNHRFSIDHQDIVSLVGFGWRDEGIVMCVPAAS